MQERALEHAAEPTFSGPQGQELRKTMIAIDAAGEEAEQHKTCPEVLVSAETPGETHTFIRMSVAVFKPVCTLVHDSFMFNWHTLLRDYAHLSECRSESTRIPLNNLFR
jgi:hypothetical protein